jgi:hypothetical protein
MLEPRSCISVSPCLVRHDFMCHHVPDGQRVMNMDTWEPRAQHGVPYVHIYGARPPHPHTAVRRHPRAQAHLTSSALTREAKRSAASKLACVRPLPPAPRHPSACRARCARRETPNLVRRLGRQTVATRGDVHTGPPHPAEHRQRPFGVRQLAHAVSWELSHVGETAV